ncbi:MAG TPA: glycoside hydrolase family 97 catalytic domain-containing protein [Bryobacteraceae bacterium]|nr:glycoside hydrolase family 97 catalytic domain-containing protein [Bryobacteraceae bacterium]
MASHRTIRVACFFLGGVHLLAADATTISSPSGRVQISVSVAGGHLSYSVSFQRQPVIETSRMGIVVDGVDLGDGAVPRRTERYRHDETYRWYGVHSTARDHANGAKIHVRHEKSGVAYTVDVRAYDDGVAFRSLVPGGGGKRRVPDEATSFRLPAGSTVWYHDFEGHYEGAHTKRGIEEVPAGAWAAPPLTFRLPAGAYGSLTEGALFRYSGMGLQADGERGFILRLGHSHPASYPFRLRYKDDIERMKEPASIEGDIATPWRIVIAGSDLNVLVNADIVHAVAPPPDLKYFPKGIRTSWIRPGRAVWKYLDGGENTLEEMRNFSNLASRLGFEYNVIEGFWQRWTPEELKGLVEYSGQRGVAIILWKHSRDLRDPVKRRAFFEMCRNAGVAGAKIDFFDHEHKEVVELYEACLRDAAEFQQVVNFHGASKPAGESRTWPNELTREAVRGMEARRIPRAAHDATLPFTRMLAGHADYTPMVFSERRNDTTWAHQIATAVSFTSPLLVYGGHPRSILENAAVDLIKSIPTVWDETRVLPGSEIGEVSALARRKGDAWFVAVMNGPAAKNLDLRLSFLGAGKYDTMLVGDSAESPAAVRVEKAVHARGDSVKLALAAGGGFVARFTQSSSTRSRKESE